LLAAQISEGRVSIVAVEQKGTVCSPLALPTVDKIVPHDLLRPAIPSESLVQLIKERLHSDNVRLVCMFNADWEGIRTVGNLPDKIRCPVCRSSLIATTYENDDALIHIAKKKIRRQLLTQDEGEIWRRSWKSASLVQSSGKKAVIAMSGRGVGPTVASRVLRRYVRSEGDFYMEILKAEREYARTRIFWD